MLVSLGISDQGIAGDSPGPILTSVREHGIIVIIVKLQASQILRRITVNARGETRRQRDVVPIGHPGDDQISSVYQR